MFIPTAEPFFYPGNKTGCLLVHGFTGTPKEMLWMGEYFSQQGYGVLGVRLAGHSTQPEDLLRMHWEDWLASVEDGYHLLKGIADQVFVIGLSMGGILSLLFAARYPISGVVAMATPYALPHDPRLRFKHLLAPIIPWLKKGPDDWQDREALKIHVEYPYLPSKGIIQLSELIEAMQASLPNVTVPTLLIHARHDGMVSIQNADQVLACLGSQDKHLLRVENGGHVIPRDQDRLLAFKAADEFIRRVQASR